MTGAKQYSRYVFSPLRAGMYLAFYTLLAAALSIVFYHSIWGIFVIGLVVLPVGLRRKRKELLIRQKQQLLREFTDCIQLVSGGLSAGYSMEHAWVYAQTDLGQLYGKQSDMYLELQNINAGIRLQEPIERLLMDFAKRSGIRDIESFCQVLAYAKRSGGNVAAIIQSTVRKIREKCEVEQEIQTALAQKKLEQKIMNIIPLFLLAYIGISSPDFIEPLYRGITGRAIMSVCLLVYGAAFLISEYMMKIEV